MIKSSFYTSLCLFISLSLSSVSAFAEKDQKVWIGDPIHGKILFEKSTSKAVKRSASWINTYSAEQSLSYLHSGRKSFPKINSENPLDLYDVLAYIRSQNIELADLNLKASHFLVTGGKLDQFALERLKERAGINVPKHLMKKRIFVAFDLNFADSDENFELVYTKNAGKRDLLKPKKKTAYVVFMSLTKLKKGDIEVAFVFNPQMELIDVQLKNKEILLEASFDKQLKKLLKQGARGKYKGLKIPRQLKNGAKASFDKQLSDAFLIASECIYMYEVKERDYFAFDVE